MFLQQASFLAGLDRPVCYHRTFLHLLAILDPIQFRKVSAREIAEATGLSQASVERALAMMEADGVILSNGAETAAKARRLSNQVVWASSAEKFQATERDRELTDARGRPGDH